MNHQPTALSKEPPMAEPLSDAELDGLERLHKARARWRIAEEKETT